MENAYSTKSDDAEQLTAIKSASVLCPLVDEELQIRCNGITSHLTMPPDTRSIVEFQGGQSVAPSMLS